MNESPSKVSVESEIKTVHSPLLYSIQLSQAAFTLYVLKPF